MTTWVVRPVRRDRGGAPEVDIRSKVTGSGHAQVKRGTQFVMPELGLKEKLTNEERMAMLLELKMPRSDESLSLRDIEKLIRLFEMLKLQASFETMRRNRRWRLSRHWKAKLEKK